MKVTTKYIQTPLQWLKPIYVHKKILGGGTNVAVGIFTWRDDEPDANGCGIGVKRLVRALTKLSILTLSTILVFRV
jgi:hypothetical protein